MGFQLSPGINTTEKDLTGIISPQVSSSIGAIAGPLVWGPANEINTFANEAEFVAMHGKPDNNTAETFFSATNFLSYAGSLRAVRVIGASGINATTGSTGVLIPNEDDYITNHSTGITGTSWVARYPGALGNSLKVSITDAQNYSTWTYKNYFPSAPSTSAYAAKTNPNANDELHVVVVDEDGQITGTRGEVIEKFAFVSKASDAKTESGEANYYKDVINRKSQWVWWGNHYSGATGPGTSWGSVVPGSTGFATYGATGVYQSLQYGITDNVPSAADLQTGYDKFLQDTVVVDLLITGGADSATVKHVIDNIATVRKDCVAFFSTSKASVVDNAGDEVTDILTYRNTTVNTNSSYAVMDGNWKYQYDKYNDLFRWIPCNADVAGLCARTDQTNDPWWSPAGLNRGQIKNVVKLAFNPTKANRDDLYMAGVNPIAFFPGQGTVLYGDKTLLAKPSAFDRINVRRLFIILEKAITKSAQYSLFEFNDAFTRAQFVAMVEPFLRDVKGRRGIYDFKVVCDETNNTPQVIDSNSFVGDIFIKPSRSINYIQLNFIAVGTGVEFNTVVGQA